MFITLSMAGILPKRGALKVTLEKIATLVKRAFGLIASAISSTVIVNFLTGEVSMPMLLSAKVFASAFDKGGLHCKALSRSIEGGGTIIAPLVLWGIYFELKFNQG